MSESDRLTIFDLLKNKKALVVLGIICVVIVGTAIGLAVFFMMENKLKNAEIEVQKISSLNHRLNQDLNKKLNDINTKIRTKKRK